MTTTIEIHESTGNGGVPAVARCSVCWERWQRPADDHDADTLIDFALRHRSRHTEPVPR
ncbi:MAG TPA: hypothetical protein VGH66_03265 [Acidimicrobiales bacterium]|jgi:hypothetical protein